MNPGYNYWVHNVAQGAFSNLQRSGSSSENAAGTNNAQRGSETGDNRAASQNPRRSEQELLGMFSGPPEYNWRGNLALAASSSAPLNFVGGGLQQYNPQEHWQILRSSNPEIRSHVPQQTNYMYRGRSYSENQNSTRTPWIRVRDVNSLNNMAQSLGRIDGGLDWPRNNINRHPSQRNYPQLLSGNSFQPPFPVIRSSPPPPYQERYPNVGVRPRAQTSSNRFPMEQQYRRKSSISVLEEMLIQTDKNAASGSTEVPRTEGRVNPPNVNREQPGFQDYSLNQAIFEKQLPYKGALETRTGEPVIPVNQEHQQQSAPSVSNAMVQTEEYSDVVFKKLSVPTEEDYNLREQRSVTESEVSEKLRKDNVPMEVESANLSMDVSAQDSQSEIEREDVSMDVLSQDAQIEVQREGDVSMDVKTENASIEIQSEDVSMDVKTEYSPVELPIENVYIKAEDDPIDIKTEDPPSSDNTLDIVIQKLKTEDQEQNEPVTQNEEQVFDESFPTTSMGWDEDSGGESETDKLLAAIPSWITSDTDLSEESFSDEEVSLPMPQPIYKSEINREKLEMLKQFIKGVERRESISKKRKTPVKEKTNRSPKKNKSPKKDPLCPILNKVVRVSLTRLTAKDLEAAKCTGYVKKTKKDEHPGGKKEPKEMGNANKPSAESEHKKLNRTNSQNPKVAQESHPKRKPEPKKKGSKRKSKTKANTENKSKSAENQTEVTKVRRNSKSPEKNKKLKTDKKKPDADANLEKAEDRFQRHDITRREKHKAQQTVEVANTEIKDGMREKKERKEKKQPREKRSEKCTTKEITNAKVLVCGKCQNVKPTPFIWMNANTRQLVCSECLKIPEPTLKPTGNMKNQETQTDKIIIAHAHSPISRSGSSTSTSESESSWGTITWTSDDEERRRKHTTGNKECRRSLDERAEKYMTRRESDEKKKMREHSPEARASTSKACLSGGSRSDQRSTNDKNAPVEFFGNLTPKSVSETEKKPERTKHRHTSKEKKPKKTKKRDTSTEEIRHKKRKSMKEKRHEDLNKTARATMEICRESLHTLKQLFCLKERERKKRFREKMERYRSGKK